MSGRLGLAIASLLILIFFLILTGLDKRTHLFDLRFLQFETSLYFASIIVLGLGAFLMFLFFSALSPFRARKSPEQQPMSPEKSSATDVVRSAEIALLAGDSDRAEALLSQVGGEHPEIWLARKLSGDLASMAGQTLKAEQLYQQSVREARGENQVPALLSLAGICEAEERFDEADALYRRVHRLLPGAIEPILRLRHIAIQSQNWNEALGWQEILEREFQVDGEEDSERVMEGAGIRCELARAELEKGSAKNASALIKHVYRMTEDYPDAYLVNGEIQKQISGPSSAYRIWDRGFQKTFSPALLVRIGDFFLDSGLPERAIEYFQSAVRTKSDPALQFCLADLHSRLEMNREAIKLFENLVQSYPSWPLAFKNLASLYHKTGQMAQAAALYAKLMERADIILQWQCYNCSMPYAEYAGYCMDCGQWNTIQFNQEQAGFGVKDDQSPAAIRY
jgi:tetratricopeptide (TPR) repeat protein